MLKRPVWNEIPTAVETITNGVAYVRVSEIGVNVLSQPLPVVSECQNPWGSMTDPVNMSR